MIKSSTVVVLCGGKSAERLVSLVSARCVLEQLKLAKFRVRLIHIDDTGAWEELPPANLLNAEPKDLLSGEAYPSLRRAARAINPWTLFSSLGRLDSVFPVLHGPMGEDGTLQGLLELCSVPYAGCGVLGSAVGMDKEISKRLCAEAGIPQVPWFVARTLREASVAASRLGYPVFVKPARMGSSIGITKVTSGNQLSRAFKTALRYDDKVLLEKGVPAREIETAVLGDPWAASTDRFALKASICAEIIPRRGFYDYRAKYLDKDGARFAVPAPLSPAVAARVREIALKAFRVLDLYGLARMDFFIHKETGAVYFNEANTLPGFTPISMYPRLWRESGIPTKRLVEILVALAHRRGRAKQTLRVAP